MNFSKVVEFPPALFCWYLITAQQKQIWPIGQRIWGQTQCDENSTQIESIKQSKIFRAAAPKGTLEFAKAVSYSMNW